MNRYTIQAAHHAIHDPDLTAPRSASDVRSYTYGSDLKPEGL
jgi:hypothetical protein